MTPGPLFRSILFALCQLVLTPPFAILGLLIFPLPRVTRYRVITVWTRIMMLAARYICGIRFQVHGAENIPATPCVILAKHQSAWETMAFQVIFPPQVWLLKRELLWIPFFGWGLAMLSPIAIDRSRGMQALKKMLDQGLDRLRWGFYIVVFPEGTRTRYGHRGRYQVGGAWLAVNAGVPVLPVAHDAGRLWPRKAFIKHPGLIHVSIGPLIPTANRTPQEVNQQAEAWIETEMTRLRHQGR